MKISLCLISAKRSKSPSSALSLVRLYMDRAAHFTPCDQRTFSSEAMLLAHVDQIAARTRPALLLADSLGQQLSSVEIADTLRFYQDGGTQHLILAIGPADGWSATARSRANKLVAFGRITLPHELAAVVAAEQLYRALTILSGHPYHCGH